MNADIIETAAKRTKKKIIRNTEKPIQKIRFIIQSLFAVIMYLDWSSILFLRKIFKQRGSCTIRKPASGS